MHPFVISKKDSYQSVINRLQDELSVLRTGRASPQIVDQVMVEAYGAPMSLKGVASISVPDAKTLTIEPWDKSLIQAIEKAIREADIGVNPVVDGQAIRLSMPQMTEEGRKKLVKTMKEKCEEARVGLRHVREEAREEVAKKEKEGLGEDEKFKMLEEIDAVTKEFVEQVETIGEAKEKEIMTV